MKDTGASHHDAPMNLSQVPPDTLSIFASRMLCKRIYGSFTDLATSLAGENTNFPTMLPISEQQVWDLCPIFSSVLPWRFPGVLEQSSKAWHECFLTVEKRRRLTRARKDGLKRSTQQEQALENIIASHDLSQRYLSLGIFVSPHVLST